jgi:oxepin-CoA hydrolase/3-oxo-5,6-dehydrosuberyl-CoA semialdehyde dehydrogenase
MASASSESYIFIEPELEFILEKLNKLTAEIQPKWGGMSAQGMVEHLSEMLEMSIGSGNFVFIGDEDKIESMHLFLDSDKPMARGTEVPFAPKKRELKHEELELSVDDFIDKWLLFEEFYDENPTAQAMHPYYGNLDKKKWRRLHSKHFSHHFHQFGIL